MKSPVEAVAIILLFSLTPVIGVWVVIGLVQVVESIGELPIDETRTRQFAIGLGFPTSSGLWGKYQHEELVLRVRCLEELHDRLACALDLIRRAAAPVKDGTQ